MRKANFKGKCQKRSLTKCKDVCRTYDDIQSAYADVLEQREDIVDFSCNVLLDGLDTGAYTSDLLVCKFHLLQDLLEVIWNALPESLNDDQKSKKLSNLLQSLKNDGVIETLGSRRYAKWRLVKRNDNQGKG